MFMGFYWAATFCARARGEAGLGPVSSGWLAFSIFFLVQNVFSLFQNNKTNITFKIKLQMSSNHFLKICTNKIHSTRHTHLVFLKKNKIMSLFKIE